MVKLVVDFPKPNYNSTPTEIKRKSWFITKKDDRLLPLIFFLLFVSSAEKLDKTIKNIPPPPPPPSALFNSDNKRGFSSYDRSDQGMSSPPNEPPPLIEQSLPAPPYMIGGSKVSL
uniref:Ovule protein n=1 Tax=Heterorhabditis bacteriophora TaxID=37862 RepID=A0A1I7WG52_HETBA